jgi:hypothetical protein
MMSKKVVRVEGRSSCQQFCLGAADNQPFSQLRLEALGLKARSEESPFISPSKPLGGSSCKMG